MTTSELVPGVHVFPHSVVDGKNAIVIGSTAALAVDACMHREEGDAMASFIREQGHQPDLLVVTHGHPDHILGSHAFRGGEVIAHVEHDRQVRLMAARHAAREGTDPDDVLSRIARPTVTFEDKHRLSLGDRDVVLFHTPGHTGDSVCVYLPDDRILIGSDTVVTGILPAFTDGDGRTLESTLRELAVLDVEHLVPGHGPVVSGAADIRNWITWHADYLGRLRELLDPLTDDADDEELFEAARFEDLVGSRFDPDSHGMVRRHEMAVLSMAESIRRSGQVG